MRPALWCVAVVCLLMPATASAQSAASRCWRGVHDGIAQHDADLVVQIVCAEVVRQAPQTPDRYRVDVYRTGTQGVLAVTQVGTTTTRRQVTIPNLEATRTAAPELVASLVRIRSRSGDDDDAPWYGWQILLADGAGIALFYASLQASSHSDTRAIELTAGLGIYGLGGPIIHVVHGNPGRATLSLGMRGIPILAGFAASDAGDIGSALGGAMLALATGLGAVAIDSAALAYEDKPEKPAPRPGAVRWTVAPTFGRNSGGLSLGGAF
ncbi:MAG: hypothetical protein HY898_13660 [Deltaproteobacteria bacterium]|nr:hypothetical protein [Deltaproteobacteria bacterium]